MIRLKCPKCSTIASLDDSEAGQVAQCDECGAKFRVPARKGAAAATEKSRAAVKQSRADEDEDEDEDEEDEESEAEGKKKGGKKKGADKPQEGARTSPARAAIAFLPVIALLGVGSIFINRLGILVAVASIFMMLGCILVVYRTSLKESPAEAVMALGFLLLAGAGIGGMYLHEGRIEERRKETRNLIDVKKTTQAPRIMPDNTA